MSAAAIPAKTRGILDRIIPSEYALGRFYVVGSALLLIGLIIFPMHLNDRLPFSAYPSLPVSFFVMMGAMALRGTAVLRWTPFDWVMLAWVILTLMSQFHGVYALNRLLIELDVATVIFQLMTMWLVFRAFYALTVVNARVAVKAALFWLIVLLSIACIIGILQSIGPFKLQMVQLAYRIGAGELAIKLGASELTGVRTTSVFSGPNIFGFINLFATCVIVGWGMASRTRLREWQAMLTIVGLALFAYANLNSQSRSSFLLSVLIGVAYIVFLIRLKKWRALFLAATLFASGLIAVVALTQTGEYDYMTKVFETGITNDESYRVRAKGIDQFSKVMNDIPVLGVGQDYYSIYPYGRGDFYSKANGTGDNGPAMAYFLLGVPGLIHLFVLNWVIFVRFRRLKVDGQQFVLWIKYVAGLTIALFWVTAPFSIRYHKIETFSYFLMIFGIVFAIVDIQKQKFARMANQGIPFDPDAMPDPPRPQPA